MSYRLIDQSPYTKHYVCDTEADLAKLPTTTRSGEEQIGIDSTNTLRAQAGSTAKVIATGDLYILQGNIDTWVKQPASGGGSGVTDYDQLSNRPVTNIKGNDIVISSLSTGVYNIAGTWKITDDDVERETQEDDLFYVLNNEDGCRLTWVTAGQIMTFSVPVGGTAEDIHESEAATVEEVAEQLVGDF